MSAEAITVDRRELSGAFKAVGDSFDVEVDGAMLTGRGFTIEEVEEDVLRRADLGRGERKGFDLAFALLSETIAKHAGDRRELAADDRIGEVWPKTPMALRSALWERGGYRLDAVRLGLLGRISALAIVFALMTLVTAGLMLNIEVALIALGGLIAAGALFLLAPGVLDGRASLQSLAQDLLDDNLAKFVAGGGRVEPGEARAIIRRLLIRELALPPDRLRPGAVLRPQFHPFRIRRSVFR